MAVPHGAATIGPSARARRHATVEVLTPDFLRKEGTRHRHGGAARRVQPQSRDRAVALSRIRPGARYDHSLRLLERAKALDATAFHQVRHHGRPRRDERRRLAVMDDLRAARCRLPHHRPVSAADPRSTAAVDRFVTPEEFKRLSAAAGEAKGFLLVAASPLTRSSYHAAEDFARTQSRAPRSAWPLRRARLHACLRDQPPRRPFGRGHVRSSLPTSRTIRNSCRSARSLKVKSREQSRERQGRAHRHHDGRLQADPRELHHRSHPRRRSPHHRGALSRRAVLASSRTAGVFRP